MTLFMYDPYVKLEVFWLPLHLQTSVIMRLRTKVIRFIIHHTKLCSRNMTIDISRYFIVLKEKWRVLYNWYCCWRENVLITRFGARVSSMLLWSFKKCLSSVKSLKSYLRPKSFYKWQKRTIFDQIFIRTFWYHVY